MMVLTWQGGAIRLVSVAIVRTPGKVMSFWMANSILQLIVAVITAVFIRCWSFLYLSRSVCEDFPFLWFSFSLPEFLSSDDDSLHVFLWRLLSPCWLLWLTGYRLTLGQAVRKAVVSSLLRDNDKLILKWVASTDLHWFLQRIRIVRNADCCNSHGLSARPSVRLSCLGVLSRLTR